jgi:DNA-directed RNA polymerase subunit RPC12/RpoP
LTIEYTCRRCTKTVAAEQYKQSHFCPACGTQLNLKPLPKHWIFQFNPSTYSWSTHSKITKQLEQWLISQHRKLISKGDLVAIWGAGCNGGIYALGKITTNPTKSALNAKQQKNYAKIDEAAKFNERPSAYVEYFKTSTEKPLLSQEVCSQDKVLAGLQVFLNPQGTNFRLQAEQWDRILELIGN